ncbi:MAG: A/G-specific adenine glycosylase [Candidatus Igneacidithiobacillus chanchocoensis]
MKRLPLADLLLPWYAEAGRHHLPWRQNRDTYRLYLAEIMLQQTRVETVQPYYQRFLARFPTWQSLAAGDLDTVLALWSGLGYYARARNAHAAAQRVVQVFGGEFPRTLTEAITLPGVGRSTAAAVLASAYGQRQAILDANARRVLFRYHGLHGGLRDLANERLLWQLAEQETPVQAHDYNQAIQDLGALYCLSRRPRCASCPLQGPCAGPGSAPVASPVAAKPRRQAWFLLARSDDDRILLEQRPQRGIWGGLWALPWFDPADPAAEDFSALWQWAEGEYALHIEIAAAQPWRQHVFTHFQLEYQVIDARLQAFGSAETARKNALFSADQLSTLALPSPLRRLLVGK